MNTPSVRTYPVILIGLLILVIELAARSRSTPPTFASDPAGAIDATTNAPASVVSTLHRACFDCHSNDTRWPWYASLPVAAWLVGHDVREGRGQLNFSRWTEYNRFDRADLLDKACELAANRDMPLWQYRILHPEARLDAADIAALCTWSRRESARLVGGTP